ncbi:tyrosine-type recombinase/integrase [Salmonella enterica subsp. arizonae]|nr:tyrosine-type recombinase/integrase [Salmonella enterica subsp. arizonae]
MRGKSIEIGFGFKAFSQFSHIIDERLYVKPIKSGLKIALPLSLNLPSLGLRLSTVIERCRLVSRSEYLINAGIRKNNPNGSIHPDSLTKKFVAARKLTGINFSENLPPFHEIRSLSRRLYKDAYGERFAQKLLGHTSENTTKTKMYLDELDDKSCVML